jgi:large subunit ribosomal protein L23
MALTLKAKYSDILIRPRITEKASFVAESNVYTFEVAPKTTKKEVMEAVKAFYNITPIRVNMVKNPAKRIFVRGKRGTTSGVKKAYVYLKEGDKIE